MDELDAGTWRLIQAYRHLLTQAESHAESAFLAQAKMTRAGESDLGRRLREILQETLSDPEAAELFAKGRATMLRDAAQRILREHGDDIKRCHQCGAVLRTPTAQQCVECGFDWHH